jgi:3',5'-cyclic AMP phosphodiesterase CpdA
MGQSIKEMKKITNLLSMALLALSMSLTGCDKDAVVNGDPNDDIKITEKDPNYKSIVVMSDIHVMAPQLLEGRGAAYDNYLSQDPKLLEYSGEVLEYLVGKTLQHNPDLVIIPGDLTKDGELVSHQLVVSILGKLRNAGIPVIVVPGNHDIDNPEGYYFNSDNTRPADRTSPEQFKALYADFGYNQAYAKDPASLSFVCEPLEGLVLLCIDTNKYEDNLYLDKGDAKNYNQTSGRIRPATLTWMLDEADKARAEGKQVVLVQHHNVV